MSDIIFSTHSKKIKLTRKKRDCFAETCACALGMPHYQYKFTSHLSKSSFGGREKSSALPPLLIFEQCMNVGHSPFFTVSFLSQESLKGKTSQILVFFLTADWRENRGS